MKSRVMLLAAAFALACSLLLGPAMMPVSAQDTGSGGSQTSGASSSQTTRSTTSTTTTQASQPAQSTSRTTTVTRNGGVDPLWLVIGGVAILAILLIAILSMRGRSRDRVTTVERETVIRK